MSEWIDRLLDSKTDQRHKQQVEQQFYQHAVSFALKMLQELEKQLRADLNHFKTKTNDYNLQWTPVPAPFEVERKTFPSFKCVLRSDSTVFTWSGSLKNSTSAPVEAFEITIQIIATGQDRLYYRVDGKDYPDASDVSRMLLEGLLSRL